MAQSNVNMSKLKRSFQMLAAKIPQRTICEQLHMGRGVLNRYKTYVTGTGPWHQPQALQSRCHGDRSMSL